MLDAVDEVLDAEEVVGTGGADVVDRLVEPPVVGEHADGMRAVDQADGDRAPLAVQLEVGAGRLTDAEARLHRRQRAGCSGG